MTKRCRFSEKEVIETLAHQGIIVTCFRCKKALIVRGGDGNLYWVDGCQREHVTELAIGGADAPHNCAYSHDGCHSKITNGTKATTAGSSKHIIAKVKRLRGETGNGPKRRIPSKPFTKSKRKLPNGKIQSRPFQRRKK